MADTTETRTLVFSESCAAAENDMNWLGADGSGTPGFPVYEDLTIDRVEIQGLVNLLYVVLRRSGHPSSDFTIDASCLGGGDEGRLVFDFHELFGAGLELKKNEVLHCWCANGAAGPTVVTCLVQVSRSTPRSNFRAIRVAGSAAAVATPAGPTVSSGNVVFPANIAYRMMGCWFNSTTGFATVARKDGRQVAFARGANAVGLGYDYKDFMYSQKAREVLSGTNQDITIGVLATAADAAAVQFITPYFEIPTGM